VWRSGIETQFGIVVINYFKQDYCRKSYEDFSRDAMPADFETAYKNTLQWETGGGDNSWNVNPGENNETYNGVFRAANPSESLWDLIDATKFFVLVRYDRKFRKQWETESEFDPDYLSKVSEEIENKFIYLPRDQRGITDANRSEFNERVAFV
jgi:hypothetical protein